MPPSVTSEMYREKYADVFTGSEMWQEISVSGGDLYEWDETSTYIQHPPFFQEVTLEDVPSVSDIKGARVLGLVPRFDHHRSHLPGWLDRPRQPGRQIPAGAWRGAA